MPKTVGDLTLRLPIADEAGSDPASLLDIARRAEDAGFSAVSISDHVVMGPRADLYPWGDFPFPPDAPWSEPLTVLTAIAARTSSLRLTTGILIVPLRPAALLAKWVATLDVISGGRLELGVGTGWQKEEFDAIGVDHGLRGQMLTDYVGACRALWTASPASFHAPTVDFTDVWCDPKPVTVAGPAILFSGTLTPRNERRIVDLGDGWIPIMGERRSGIADGVARLRGLYEKHGRPQADLRVRSGARIATDAAGAPDVAATIESAPAMLDLGVTDIDLPFSFFVRHVDGIPAFFDAAAAAIASSGWVRS